MLKCPNNNCCKTFSEADLRANWRTFQEGTCYLCGTQHDWGLDISKYKPAPVAAPAKKAPAKKAPAKKASTKKKAPAKKKAAAKKK